MSVFVWAVDRARRLVPVALMMVLGILASRGTAKDWSGVRPGTGAAEQRILEALDETTQFHFVDQPLSEVILSIEQVHKIEIHLDQGSLEEEGISTDTLVNLELRGLTLRAALWLLLRDFDLSYVIANETLLITTADMARQLAGVRIYDVSSFINEQQPPDALGQLINFALSRGRQPAVGVPVAEADNRRSARRRRGGPVFQRVRPAEVQYMVHGNLMVVRAPDYDQHRVEQFLEALAELQK